MSTLTPCVDQASLYVNQMMLPNLPERGVKGALELLRRETGVSFWKLRKLYNPNLRTYGLSLLADEWTSIKAAHARWLDNQEQKLTHELENLRALRAARQQGRFEFNGDETNGARAVDAPENKSASVD